MILSPQERHIFIRERQNLELETLKRLRDDLYIKLQEKSRQYKSQFPFLDDSFRVSLSLLSKNFPQQRKTINDSILRVRKREQSFFKQTETEESIKRLRGEIVELAKTYFQEELFRDQFIIFRTSKFDDYVNHVDEIIFDKQTLTPIAAIDTTIGYEK